MVTAATVAILRYWTRTNSNSAGGGRDAPRILFDIADIDSAALGKAVPAAARLAGGRRLGFLIYPTDLVAQFDQSTRAPESLTTLAHLTISALINASNSSGALVTGSPP